MILGFNIAILAGLFSTLFSRLLGARRGALAAALGIAFYTLLVGAVSAWSGRWSKPVNLRQVPSLGLRFVRSS